MKKPPEGANFIADFCLFTFLPAALCLAVGALSVAVPLLLARKSEQPSK
jgi:hypothetical protein